MSEINECLIFKDIQSVVESFFECSIKSIIISNKISGNVISSNYNLG